MFIGQFPHAFDAKGRVNIPSAFRDALVLAGSERGIVLARNRLFREPCLEAYPQGEWQRLMEEFGRRPRFDAETHRFEALFLHRSHACEIDAAGRVLVPPAMRQFAGLKKDVVFLGADRRFRLMDPVKWSKVEGELETEAGEVPALFQGSGL